ncbi:hypothetical protein LCGC14_2277600 [marine sediment metagenome]|uniref:Uncharacterized protein n=1 Tax=marine sediment metagenome TaxID=412755 RepID=A0A0F9DHC3_9ZZZZ
MINGLNPIGIAVLVVVAAGSFWGGSALKQAEWTEDKNAALELQAALTAKSDVERRELNEKNLLLQLDLEEAKRDTERMRDDVQDAINRASVVKTFTVKTPQDCPALRCNIVDAAEHYRLFNAAISNTLEALPDAGETRILDARLRGAYFTPPMDGLSEFDD